MAISHELRQRIRELAGVLQKEMYGETGSPELNTRFTDIEDATTEVGDALTCELLSGVLQAHSDHTGQRLGKACECSVCGRNTARDDIQPRVVQARRGDATWREPRYFCQSCRKAFFPSVESIGR